MTWSLEVLPERGPLPLSAFAAPSETRRGPVPQTTAAQPQPAPQAAPTAAPSLEPRPHTRAAEPAARDEQTHPTPRPRSRPNHLLWRGRLAQDPNLRRSKSGIDYCVIRVLQEVLTSQRHPVTQGIDVVLYRERAHHAAVTFRRGDVVEVSGELRIREWTDASGSTRVSVSLHPSEDIVLIRRQQRAEDAKD